MKVPIFLLLIFSINIDAAPYIQIALKIFDRYIAEVLDVAGNETACVNQLKMYLTDIQKLEIWALSMLDSTAKVQPGLLTGNLVQIGNYDECLEINVNRNGSEIKGQYCRSAVTPGETVNECVNRKFAQKQITGLGKTTVADLKDYVQMYWDVCIPAACSATDLQTIWDFAEDRYELKLHLTFSDDLCNTVEKQRYYTPLNIAAIAIFSIIGLLVLSSTLYDVFVFQKLKDQDYNLFMAFSYYTNGKRLLSIKSADETKITCLHGIRVISITWIILGHRYLLNFLGTAINFTYVGELLRHRENMFIIAAFACVDSFFVISGFLIVYLTMFARENGIKINLFVFYAHRFVRLTPSLAAIVLLHAGLLVRLGSGPFWNYVNQHLVQKCVTHWWSTLLFIQNYLHPMNGCMLQTWYLSADTQLYVLSPLLFLPLRRWPKATIVSVVGLILVSIASAVHATYYYEIDSVSIQAGNDFFIYVYTPTHIRMGPWLAGFLLGYFMWKSRSKKIFIKKTYVLLLWTTCLILMLLTMFCYIEFFNIKFTVLMAAIFCGISRLIWGACICWVIFACSRGFGGYINKFLSLSIFGVLARLTFSMYLTHAFIIGVVQGQRGTHAYVHNLFHFYEVWGDLAFTIGLSVIWTLTFESPVTILEKVLTKRAMEKNKNSNKMCISKRL